ncbi:5-hydroxytryptamine receptor 1A-beta-like [Diadema antillarum]|uniref:5-hydroxytryptamine receptor 1A-beta-like n=1 Tax=Diadema antillarum TaxID=105358 RepID=UPI003A879896
MTTYQWPPNDHGPRSAAAVLEGLTLAVIIVVAFAANLLAMAIMVRDKRLRSNLHSALIFTLICMDLGVVVTSMTFSIWSVYDNGHFLRNNKVMCTINGFCATFFKFGNFLTILMISIDRYLTIVWSVRFPPTRLRTVVFLVVCWIVPLFVAVPPAAQSLSKYEYLSDTHHCSPRWDCPYYVIMFVFLYGIVLPVMLICYVAVFRTIRRQELLMKRPPKMDNETTVACGFGTTLVAETQFGKLEGGESTVSCLQGDTDRRGVSAKDDSSDGTLSLPLEEPPEQEAVCKHQSKRKKRHLQLRRRRLRADKRVALTGVLLVLTTVVCWCPYFVVHYCFNPTNPAHWEGVVSMWFGYSNSSLDPIIYAFMNRRVRQRLRSLIRRTMDRYTNR